jgi:hypothetical protein
MLRYVRQRLMKPELADPFILWKEWWEGLCRAAKGQPRTAEDLLSEEMGLRRALQDEKGALHGRLEEAQQALHLAKVALSDERRALAAARAELQDLKRIEIQARESLTKRRSADARFKELQRSQAEAMSSLERERREGADLSSFLAWWAQHGDDCSIVAPEGVKDRMHPRRLLLSTRRLLLSTLPSLIADQ